MDFKDIGEKMSEMQDKIKAVDAKIKTLKATRESGAGLVKATVTGDKKLVGLVIDDQLLHKDEKETLQDLVMAAVNLAMDEVEEEVKKERRRISADLFGPLAQGW